MPTLNNWEYVGVPTQGFVLTGILGDDTGRNLRNGRRIFTSAVLRVCVRADSPVAVTKSGTHYRLLDPAPAPSQFRPWSVSQHAPVQSGAMDCSDRLTIGARFGVVLA